MPNFVTSGNLSIHYKTHGFDKDGTVLVFLNGMTQSTRHWSSQVRELRDQFRILTYDARGQGGSDNPRQAPTLDEHARDLRELLDHLKLKKVDLVGFSHGARIALGVATQYKKRVRRLVLCSATAAPTALARTIVRSWRELLNHGGLPALSWAALPTILGNEFLTKNEALLPNIVRASVERNSLEGTALLLEGLINFPPLDDLAGKVKAPTLVISADADPLVTPEGAQKLAQLCGGTHQLVTNSGHTIPIERPRAFRKLVTQFLTAVDDGHHFH